MKLHLRESSAGEPLVILHGLFGSGDNWSSVARELPGRRCLMPDLINHGASPQEDSFDLTGMAEDVLETIDDAGVDRFDVMGHSLGGKIALLVALKAPGRVRRLVILDVAPKVYEERHRFIIEALKKVAAADCSSRKEADEVLAESIPQRPIRAFLLKNFVPTDGGYEWRINLDALDRRYHELVSWPDISATFSGPALVIAGGRSSYVVPQDEELFRSYLEEPEIHILPEAGHWVHTDDREAFLDLLKRFLDAS
jgi:esterase